MNKKDLDDLMAANALFIRDNPGVIYTMADDMEDVVIEESAGFFVSYVFDQESWWIYDRIEEN